MNIKQAIVVTNDFMCYVCLFLVSLVAVLCVFNEGVVVGLLVFLGGWVLCSLMFGLWFVLSKISEDLMEQVRLTKEQNRILNRNMD
jgi:hypothetical protein